MSMRLLLALGGLGAASLLAAADSVVLVSTATRYDEGWSMVVARLESAHGAQVLTFRASPAELQEELRRQQPRFVTWVARPEELGPKAAVVMHPMFVCGEARLADAASSRFGLWPVRRAHALVELASTLETVPLLAFDDLAWLFDVVRHE